MKHLCAIATSYPGPLDPRAGLSTAQSYAALAGMRSGAQRNEAGRDENWRVTIVNPVPIPPLAFGRLRDCLEASDGSTQAREPGSIAVRHVPFTQVPALSAWRDPGAIARSILPLIERIDAATPIDLIAANSLFPDGPAAARIARMVGVPLSIAAIGPEIATWRASPPACRQLVGATLRAGGLLAPGETARLAMIALGIPAEPIAVHRPGLDRDRFRPLDHTQLRAQLSAELGFAIADTMPLLVCTRLPDASAGEDIAIAALARIEGARLIVVGANTGGGPRALAADPAIGKRVLFTGALDPDVLPLILSAADAMVLPGARAWDGEGAEQATIEALACGTPVVTGNTAQAREIVTSPIAGRLVECDPGNVAAGVNAILNDPPLQRDVAACVADLSWERHARELAAHCDRLIAVAG